MQTALVIMMLQGLLGAWDTLYYHELVCRLPAHARVVAGELRLHALRDLVYGVLFLSLPFLTWQGMLAGAVSVYDQRIWNAVPLLGAVSLRFAGSQRLEKTPRAGFGSAGPVP